MVIKVYANMNFEPWLIKESALNIQDLEEKAQSGVWGPVFISKNSQT
jgi:exopolysaccharide biosynthesis protein